MSPVNVTIQIEKSKVLPIRELLEKLGFEFSVRDHAYFSAKKNRLHVTIYEKGPKVLVQGYEAADFTETTLTPFLSDNS